MAEIKVADVVAKILKEEGVEWYAGVPGGHIWQLMVAIARAGIKMYHMRHEQSGVYMADGWARATGKPGVAMGTAGPGFGNMISAMYQAWLWQYDIRYVSGLSSQKPGHLPSGAASHQ